MNISRFTLALVICCLIFGSIARADDPPKHPMMQAIGRVFEKSQQDEFKEYGLNNASYAANAYNDCIVGMWLFKGEAKINTIEFKAGVEYAIIGGGDDNAGKLDLKILDSKGKGRAAEGDEVVTFDTQGGKEPAVVFTPKKTGRFGIRIEMLEANPDTGKDNSYASYVIMRKGGGWDLPMENFKAAAEMLAKRIAKVAEANNNDADLMFASVSLHGVVLPKNGYSTSDYGGAGATLDPKQETAIVVAGDGNANPIEMTVSGAFRAPKPAEKDDEDPKVTYKRTASKNPIATVKNIKADTSLVMVGLVQITKTN